MAQVVVELDASGDFIIELSSSQSSSSSEKKTHLLVSSKVLTLLSPVLGKVLEEWEIRARARGAGGENENGNGGAMHKDLW